MFGRKNDKEGAAASNATAAAVAGLAYRPVKRLGQAVLLGFVLIGVVYFVFTRSQADGVADAEARRANTNVAWQVAQAQAGNVRNLDAEADHAVAVDLDERLPRAVSILSVEAAVEAVLRSANVPPGYKVDSIPPAESSASLQAIRVQVAFEASEVAAMNALDGLDAITPMVTVESGSLTVLDSGNLKFSGVLAVWTMPTEATIADHAAAADTAGA
ncbi:MAG: hypothetical protein GY882_01805 [Actinomycetia bacterium]|nr:hypothetical protein [Actinomycetes bacterium]MCP4844905.1 hypothetical protein [Actinomycetes bacterium]